MFSYITVERIMEKLTAKYWFTSVSGDDGPSRVGRKMLQSGSMQRYAVFQVAGGITVNDMRKLKKGGRFHLERDLRSGALYGEIRVR